LLVPNVVPLPVGQPVVHTTRLLLYTPALTPVMIKDTDTGSRA
jgi:hypothetical protein